MVYIILRFYIVCTLSIKYIIVCLKNKTFFHGNFIQSKARQFTKHIILPSKSLCLIDHGTTIIDQHRDTVAASYNNKVMVLKFNWLIALNIYV